MNIKTIDLSKSVYDLCKEYPELPEVLAELGFHDIIKPGMLATVGRFMTLPKGALAKNIELETIQLTLLQHGYETITGKKE